MRSLDAALFLLALLPPAAGAQAVHVQAPTWGTVTSDPPRDPRFFGTYYGRFETELELRYDLCFLGICFERVHREAIRVEDIVLQLDLRSLEDGDLLVGGGQGVLHSSSSPETPTVPVSVAGRVVGEGRARSQLCLRLPDQRTARGTALLSADGRELSVPTPYGTLRLRKDAGPNRAPVVQIQEPSPGSQLPHGFGLLMRATASDPDQASIPFERVRWSSDRDGFLGNGLLRYHGFPTLSPGPHTLSVEVIDDGGLLATDSVSIVVVNRPPLTPWISSPGPQTQLGRGCPVELRGGAVDPEEGVLSGSSLRWSSDREGLLGVGASLSRPLQETGAHVITLTAIDALGAKSQTSLTVQVDGDAPRVAPQPVILRPLLSSSAALVVPADRPTTFEGLATDCDSDPAVVQLEWFVGAILPTGLPLNLPGGSGPLVDLTFTAGGPGPRVLIVTLRATDDTGLSNETRVYVTVVPADDY